MHHAMRYFQRAYSLKIDKRIQCCLSLTILQHTISSRVVRKEKVSHNVKDPERIANPKNEWIGESYYTETLREKETRMQDDVNTRPANLHDKLNFNRVSEFKKPFTYQQDSNNISLLIQSVDDRHI